MIYSANKSNVNESEKASSVTVKKPEILIGMERGEDEEANKGNEMNLVMSEIHLGCHPDAKTSFSRFSIWPPVRSSSSDRRTSVSPKLAIDEEGDLVVSRRQRPSAEDTNDTIILHHHNLTDIPKVGLQVWRASLLLGDFILHSIRISHLLHDVVALELGAGTGLDGMLTARAARTVFITDFDDEILENCHRNVELNCHTFRNTRQSAFIRKLDWKSSWPPDINEEEHSKRYKYSWISSDLEKIKDVSIFLAADVIYTDDLTHALFSMLKKLMPQGSNKILFLSLEKRYNFTVEDLDIVAHGYDYFRTFFEEISESSGSLQKAKNVCDDVPYFIGKQIDIAKIPQYIQKYHRGNDLELWEIKARPCS